MSDPRYLEKQKELQKQQQQEQFDGNAAAFENREAVVTETDTREYGERMSLLKTGMQDFSTLFKKEWSKQDVVVKKSWAGSSGNAFIDMVADRVDMTHTYSLQTFALGTETMKQEKRSATATDLQDSLEEWHKLTENKEGMPEPAECVDRLFELSMASTNYWFTHDKKRYYSFKGKGRALVAKKARNMVSDTLSHLLTEEEKKEIRSNEGADYQEGESDKKIEKDLQRAAKAYRNYCTQIGRDCAGYTPEGMLERKMRVFRLNERKLKLYRESHPEVEKRDPMIQEMIREYEETLAWKKLFALTKKKEQTAEKEEQINQMIDEQLLKEGDIEIGRKDEAVDPNDTEELQPEQLKGIEEIDNWLVRNFQNGGVMGAMMNIAKNQNADFVDSVLSMSKRERLHMYYLVEKKRRRDANVSDVGMSQTYVPTLKGFKDQMVATKFKFWKRIAGEYTYMQKLDDAFHVTMKYRGEIKAVKEIESDQKKKLSTVETAKQKEAPMDTATKRLDKMMELRKGLEEYLKDLKEAKKADKKKKAIAEGKCKDTAAYCESLMKEIAVLDGKVGEEKDYIRKKENGEDLVNEAASSYSSVGDLPGMAFQATVGGGLLMNAKWDLLSAGWSKANLWTGSIGEATAGAVALLGSVTTFASLCRNGNQMSGAEIAEKTMEMTRGLVTALHGAVNIAQMVAVGGNLAIMQSAEYVAMSGAVEGAVGAVGLVLDTGVMIARAVGAGKMKYHGKKAGKFFAEKRKEALKKENKDRLTAEKQRELKYEEHMMKLQKDLQARERDKAIVKGVGVGLSVATIFVPGLAFAAAAVAIVGTIKEYGSAYEIRDKLFDSFFKMDELSEKVAKLRYGKRRNTSRNLSDPVDAKCKAALRKRVAARAGFCDMRSAAEFVCSKFARLVRSKLFGEGTGEEEKKGYIQFVKAINLRYNAKKKLPDEHMLVRKLTAQ